MSRVSNLRLSHSSYISVYVCKHVIWLPLPRLPLWLYGNRKHTTNTNMHALCLRHICVHVSIGSMFSISYVTNLALWLREFNKLTYLLTLAVFYVKLGAGVYTDIPRRNAPGTWETNDIHVSTAQNV